MLRRWWETVFRLMNSCYQRDTIEIECRQHGIQILGRGVERQRSDAALGKPRAAKSHTPPSQRSAECATRNHLYQIQLVAGHEEQEPVSYSAEPNGEDDQHVNHTAHRTRCRRPAHACSGAPSSMAKNPTATNRRRTAHTFWPILATTGERSVSGPTGLGFSWTATAVDR
jgi:hypothetical protein